MTPSATRIGSHTIANQMPAVASACRTPTRLADARSTSALRVELLLRRDHRGLGLSRSVTVSVEYAACSWSSCCSVVHLLDLAADRRQLGLDGEDVRDLRRLVHDRLEGPLGRLEVRDPGPEVDDLAGHVLRLRSARRAPWSRARAAPASASSHLRGRDPVRDRGLGTVAVAGPIRAADVAAERIDLLGRGRQRGIDAASTWSTSVPVLMI